MPRESHAEIERTYAVALDAPVPDLTGVDGVASMGAHVQEHLDAVYFDTDDLSLARRGIVLRRRTGGEDEGWHLKLPAGRDERTEIRRPLGRAVKTVPAPLRAIVRAVSADRTLVPVARVTTARSRYPVLDANGTVLADLCDDQVATERLLGEPHPLAWREWEIELDHGGRQLLDLLDAVVRGSGGNPGAVSSKLAHALADLRPPARRAPTPQALRRGSAADLVTAHLRRHLDGLLVQDVRMRSDATGAVHRTRIEARRLRSALTTYRPLLVAGSVDPLRGELRWLGQSLSTARDAQVQLDRLTDLVAAEPDDLVQGRVTERIASRLRETHRAGLAEGLTALDSRRYLDLLQALEQLVEEPPFRRRAERPATKVVPRLLQRDARRLERAVDAAERAVPGPDRDTAFHEARKKTKRLRYALETSVPLYGRRAERSIEEVTLLQDVLGQHQDSVVARALLHEYAAQVHLEGGDTFTFGRLHAAEEQRGHASEAEFARLWKRRPTARLRRRLEE